MFRSRSTSGGARWGRGLIVRPRCHGRHRPLRVDQPPQRPEAVAPHPPRGPAPPEASDSWTGFPRACSFRPPRCRFGPAFAEGPATRRPGEPGPCGEFVARAVTGNLYRFVVPALAGPRRLVPLVSLAPRRQSVFTLRAAIDRGRLRAQTGSDSRLHSTRVWVDEYAASRCRRNG
jgi:hypothetical protein